MKQAILFLSLIFTLSLYSQITITKSDMPNPGDTLRKSKSLDAGIYDFTLTGDNYVWDFSDLQPLSQSVDEFMPMSEVAYIYQITYYGSANLAHPSEAPASAGELITDPFQFLNNVNSTYEIAGGGFSVEGSAVPIKFDSPDQIYLFPMQNGDSHSSFSSYNKTIPGFGHMEGTKQRDSQVDGYGVVTTPYGTFDVLRVKADIEQFDSIYLDEYNFGFPIYQNYTEYHWVAQGEGIPVLFVIDGMAGSQIYYRDSVRDLTVSIEEEKALVSKLYPNPASDVVTISNVNSAGFESLSLLTIQGEVIYSTENKTAIQNKEIRINLKELGIANGLYFIELRSDKQIQSKKLLVQ